MFLNPFNPLEFNKAFELNFHKYQEQCERQAKEHDERVRLHRVNNIEELKEALENSRAENRTPLVVSSLESKVCILLFKRAIDHLPGVHAKVSK